MNFTDRFLALNDAARSIGLNCFHHVAVLAILHKTVNGTTLSFIANRILVSSAVMTGIADKLEKMCLVERDFDPKDRRVIRLQITSEGAAALKLITGEK